MTHRRTALRAAFVTRLGQNIATPPATPAYRTAAGARVFSSRLMPVEEPELPAIIVHTRDPEEVTARSISGLNGYEQRRCIVTIVCIAQSFDDLDDDLDAMAAQVEAAIESWEIPGFESAEIEPHTTDSEDPEYDGALTTGATRLRIPVTYLAPYRDGPDPYTPSSYPGSATGAACPVQGATITSNGEEL